MMLWSPKMREVGHMIGRPRLAVVGHPRIAYGRPKESRLGRPRLYVSAQRFRGSPYKCVAVQYRVAGSPRSAIYGRPYKCVDAQRGRDSSWPRVGVQDPRLSVDAQIAWWTSKTSWSCRGCPELPSCGQNCPKRGSPVADWAPKTSWVLVDLRGSAWICLGSSGRSQMPWTRWRYVDWQRLR